jgi:pyruvate/2-oxoglutarate/acetoin dehydrogenase E1 component/TPP-dependent pyruvate/acetoin dehydrogenase alpha subunit
MLEQTRDEAADLRLTHATLSYDEIVSEYRLAWRSRRASLVGRREVMSGKAKFGIFGDGKEVAQLAMARAFQPGDWRSGYYRDQTFMLATGAHTLPEFFAQLYADADVSREPATGGRSMNAHFASRLLDDDGRWLAQTDRVNVAADLSPTGSQMPRLVGLTYASRLYRDLETLQGMTDFSRGGNEIAWGTIGNATCAEGMFWESVNAIGVLGGPAVISIWDDGYGISVPNEHQITKDDLSAVLAGFQRRHGSREGFDIYTVRGWDYPALVDTYLQAAAVARTEHVPSILHVIEMTQPQGHSTSGSHERYKSTERLAWEDEYDPLRQMRLWMIGHGMADEASFEAWEREDRATVEAIREQAWDDFLAPIRAERDELLDRFDEVAGPGTPAAEALAPLRERLAALEAPSRRDLHVIASDALLALYDHDLPEKQVVVDWKRGNEDENLVRYGSHLHDEGATAATLVEAVAPVYGEQARSINGFEVLNHAFDSVFERDPRVIAFGEDVGKIGGVNQGMRGMQDKYGTLRVADTGIRETTIIGQAIGLALRGLRPIAEIQYLDYILYCLQIMSDDLASLRWRTAGGQKAPVIIRTRGHRLEGIWHAGSPMAGILNLVRGIHVLVPRDMTRAAAFYNTLLAADEPGLIVEVLNGYRLKERLPDNIGEIRLRLGQVDLLREGRDVTVVTYGPNCRLAMEAAGKLAAIGIELEVIDVQSLLPFDTAGDIGRSLAKTGRVIFFDEDVPGGTTAYMLQQVIEKQGGFYELDSEPRTISAQPHRPAYGSDGDYFSKPTTEGLMREVVDMMNEVDPQGYPMLW